MYSAERLRCTYNGDADLNGKIDADDYFQIDSGFAQHLIGYRDGDFDSNGVVDADDYFLIDRAFAGQSNTLSQSNSPALKMTTGNSKKLSTRYLKKYRSHHRYAAARS